MLVSALALGSLLSVAVGPASSDAGLSLEAFPELLDRSFLRSLAARERTATDRADAPAAPPMPQEFTATILILNQEAIGNTTLLGDACVFAVVLPWRVVSTAKV